jgi:hypothetical protein
MAIPLYVALSAKPAKNFSIFLGMTGSRRQHSNCRDLLDFFSQLHFLQFHKKMKILLGYQPTNVLDTFAAHS